MFVSLCLSPSSPQSYDGDKKNNAASLARMQEKPYINARVPANLIMCELL